MKKLLSRIQLQPGGRVLLWVGSLALVLAVLAGSVLWVRPKFKERYQKRIEEEAKLPAQYIEKSGELAKMGSYDDAFSYLQEAVEKSKSVQERATAGVAMGEFLLLRARQQPVPYAQMARGYLDAASRLDPTPDQKIVIYKALAEVGVLLKDVNAAMDACEAAKTLIRDDREKVELLLFQTDALLKIGTWSSLNPVWEKLAPYKQMPEWKSRVAMKEADIMEQLLLNDSWYQEWMKQRVGRQDPVTLRASLFQNAMTIYGDMADTDTVMAPDALFRAARLCSAENNFEEAQRRIREYFTKGYRGHQEDILLILIRMARMEGNVRRTEDMISMFMDRFKWYSRAASELLAVIAQAESIGHIKEAYDIMTAYLGIPAAKENWGDLQFKAGELATRLKLYDKAADHLNEVLKSRPGDDLYASTLLAQADVCLQRGDYENAQKWLIRVLTQFPYDPRRGKVLYQLVDVFSQSKAPLSDILLVTSLAIDVAPDDPSAVKVLMQLARTYEDLGLYPEAQDKYAKVALLRAVDASKKEKSPSGIDSTIVSEALLGSARCLLNMGETVRADRLLREICQTVKKGRLFHDAAFLWASLAIKDNQRMEARRRLALIDLDRCAQDMAGRVQIEQMLLDVADDQKTPEDIVEFMNGVKGLADTDRDRYALRAYTQCFDRLIESSDLDRMQSFIDRVAEQNLTLPISMWVMQLGSLVLNQKGAPAFVECMNRNLKHLDQLQAGGDVDINSLVALANSCEDIKSKVNKYIQ